ncbi:MAG: FHA domain-containing protein [Myxococcota bacterium]
MSGHDGEDSPPEADSDEKTAALSLEDMGLEDDEGEATAAISLEDLGLDFDAPASPPSEATPEDSEEDDEDTEDKTAAFSLEDMGITPEAPPAPPQVEEAPEDSAEDEDTEDKTAAFSLEDMGIAPEAPPAPPQVEEAPEDSAEDEDTEDKTAAFSLEDMGITPEAPPAPPQVEAPATDVQEERTAALSLEDMGVAQLDSLEEEEEEEEETEAMPPARPPQAPPSDEERTAAMSLEDMGVASADPDDERTAAMSIADMGLEDAPPPPELEIRNGNDRGQSFVIAGASQTVGRGLDCDVVLNDASVSRKHFRLDKTASGYRMVDLGSGNGTKINGVRLSEFDLAHGTIIEAGTTTMAWKQLDKPAAAKEFKEGWDDNAESTRVSDLAAISVLPEWKEQVQKEEQAKVVAAQRGPLKMIVMLLSIIIALMLGFMGLDKALNMGVIFDDGTAAEADLAAAEAKREAIELMNAGKEAFTEREWSKARKKFKAALKLDEDVREGKRYLDKTKDEAAAFKALRRGRAALDDEQYAEAVEELSKINDASLYYSEDGEGGEGAVDLLSQAIDSFVEAKLLDSQRLDEEGDAAGALAAIEAALKLAPEDASVIALKAELSEDAEGDADPQAKPSPPTTTAERPSPAPRTSKRAPRTERAETPRREAKAAPEKAAEPSRAERTETTSSSSRATAKTSARSAKKKKKKQKKEKSAGMLVALSSYASGDFSAAISELKKLSKRGSRKAKAKAKRLAAAVENFKGLYVPAMAAAKSFRSPTKTIKSLRAARKLDASISGAYSKRIRKELARQLAFQANQAWSSKKFGKAGRHARQALALDPQLTQAKKIYTEVQAEAQGWFDQAKAAASSNPDKAMQLLSRVVSIFPRGDQRYKEAYKLLNQLAAEEED